MDKRNPIYKYQIQRNEVYPGVKSPAFRRILPYLTGKKVLDIGCGSDTNLSLLSKDSIGIDISDKNVEHCKKVGLNALKMNINEKLLFESESFDAILASHILEHVDSPLNLLKEIARVAKKEAIVAIAVPKEYSLMTIIYPYFDNRGEHLYSFSPNGIRALLDEVGLSTIKMIPDFSIIDPKKFWLTYFFEPLYYIPMRFISRIYWAYWVIAKKP